MIESLQLPKKVQNQKCGWKKVNEVATYLSLMVIDFIDMDQENERWYNIYVDATKP